MGADLDQATYESVVTLTLDGYQRSTAETAIYPGKGTSIGLTYCALKLAGEAGEVAEKVGKAIRDDGFFNGIYVDGGEVQQDGVSITPDRREALKAELGDVLWYVAAAARELGYDLSDIAQGNLDKLASRKARGLLSGSGDTR